MNSRISPRCARKHRDAPAERPLELEDVEAVSFLHSSTDSLAACPRHRSCVLCCSSTSGNRRCAWCIALVTAPFAAGQKENCIPTGNKKCESLLRVSVTWANSAGQRGTWSVRVVPGERDQSMESNQRSFRRPTPARGWSPSIPAAEASSHPLSPAIRLLSLASFGYSRGALGVPRPR